MLSHFLLTIYCYGRIMAKGFSRISTYDSFTLRSLSVTFRFVMTIHAYGTVDLCALISGTRIVDLPKQMKARDFHITEQRENSFCYVYNLFDRAVKLIGFDCELPLIAFSEV